MNLRRAQLKVGEEAVKRSKDSGVKLDDRRGKVLSVGYHKFLTSRVQHKPNKMSDRRHSYL